MQVTCQHDLAILDEKDGRRYTDEDQRNKWATDYAYEFLPEMEGVRLYWGGGPVGGGDRDDGGTTVTRQPADLP